MNQKLLDQLKADPETLAAVMALKEQDSEAAALFSPLEVDEMSSASEVAKQFNARLAGIQKWVEKTVHNASSQVKEDIHKKSQESESKRIVEFAKTHPELVSGSDVAAIMEQLYANGNHDLENIYKKACISCDKKPVAIGEDGKKTNLATGNVIGEDGKEVAKKKGETVSSLRSDTLLADTEDVESGELQKTKDIEGKSIREIASENWTAALAEAGITDIPE